MSLSKSVMNLLNYYPGYKYYVVTNKVEIFNKDRSKLNQLMQASN